MRRRGLAGVECLSGIPGSTGATPIQNVGAYGQDVSETIVSVSAYDRGAGTVVELGPEHCGFAYRSSAFKGSDRYVVLRVSFALERSPLARPIRYAELARTLGVAPGERPPLLTTREAVLELRRRKGMVIDPGDPDSVSAGSFFLNPILSREAFASLERRATERLGEGTQVPVWPDANGSGEDLGRLADRARRVSPGVRERARRHLLQAHTRDRQPRRRDQRRARRARPRDARRGASRVRREPASRADARRRRALEAVLGSERERVVVYVGGQRAALHAGQGALQGRAQRGGESRVQIRRTGQRARRARPARSRSTPDPGPRAPAEPAREARVRRRSRSAPRTTPLPRPRAARGRRAFPTGPARSMRPGTTLRPTRRASSRRRARRSASTIASAISS